MQEKMIKSELIICLTVLQKWSVYMAMEFTGFINLIIQCVEFTKIQKVDNNTQVGKHDKPQCLGKLRGTGPSTINHLAEIFVRQKEGRKGKENLKKGNNLICFLPRSSLFSPISSLTQDFNDWISSDYTERHPELTTTVNLESSALWMGVQPQLLACPGHSSTASQCSDDPHSPWPESKADQHGVDRESPPRDLVSFLPLHFLKYVLENIHPKRFSMKGRLQRANDPVQRNRAGQGNERSLEEIRSGDSEMGGAPVFWDSKKKLHRRGSIEKGLERCRDFRRLRWDTCHIKTGG